MKIYFAEQGNNWGYNFGTKVNFAPLAMYDEGGVFDFNNRKGKCKSEVDLVEVPFGSCILHYNSWHKIYCAIYQEIRFGDVMLNCIGYGKSKQLSIKNLVSCRKHAIKDLNEHLAGEK